MMSMRKQRIAILGFHLEANRFAGNVKLNCLSILYGHKSNSIAI